MESNEVLKTIRRVTWVGFWVNALLMVLKIVCGYYGHSDALVADGVHSMSDFATDLIVLLLVGIAYKQADPSHPYGHGKYETMASVLIAIILCGAGVLLGIEGIESIKAYMEGTPIPRPDAYTIIVAAIGILGKEWLFRYTMAASRRTGSSSLVANAWHHRSDALSSVATLVGVSAGYLLGARWNVLDPAATVLISAFIIISAVQIALPAIKELLEAGLPPSVIEEIGHNVAQVPGVKAFHHLRTRRNGHTTIVDLHVKVDPDITVTQGHDIATAVEQKLKAELGQDAIISVHIEPYHPQKDLC